MKQKRAYRPLTEAEKRYIDRLVNEAWTDSVKNFGNNMKNFVTDISNSAKNSYQNFHNSLNGKKTNRNPVNMSPWEVQWKTAYNDSRTNGVPTDRSQWSQLNDFLADIVTNGQHSQRKNALLNQQMQNSIQTGKNQSYWIKKLLDYWGHTYVKKVNGNVAVNDFDTWFHSVSNTDKNQYEGNLYMNIQLYIQETYGKAPISYNGFLNYLKNKKINNQQPNGQN